MSQPSGSRPRVNLRSTAVKRIMQEASELANPEEDDFAAGPLESDIFEWHCTMRGVAGSEYEGGLYHLRILLPPSYPMSAPDIMLLTPNGRFELGKKICIDGLTSFHAGSWQPAWGVRTAILGLRSFWMQGGEALSAIGALDYSKEERKRLARLSRGWKCPMCAQRNGDLLPDRRQSGDRPGSALAAGSMAEGDTIVKDVGADGLAMATTSAEGCRLLPAEEPSLSTSQSATTVGRPAAPPPAGSPPDPPLAHHSANPGTAPSAPAITAAPPVVEPLGGPVVENRFSRARRTPAPAWMDMLIFVWVVGIALLLGRKMGIINQSDWSTAM